MGIYTDSNGDARTINIGGNSLKLIQNNPDSTSVGCAKIPNTR